jgi:ketosteroid isomerase-like protein
VSESHADLVRRALLASNRGDIEEFLACLHPEVEWRSSGIFLHPERTWQGRLAIREGLRRGAELRGGHPHVTLREIQAREELVLVLGAVSVPAARRPVLLPSAWIFEVRDGMAARVEAFTSEQAARAAWQRRRDGSGRHVGGTG